jgi:phosphoglycerol transferase
MVPFLVLIVIWIWSAKPIFFKKNGEAYIIDFPNYKAVFSIIVLSIAGSGGIYYSFFFAFFAAIAGISAYLSRKNKYHFYSSLLLIFIISCSVFINLLPNTINRIVHGKNSEVARRSPIESELYALKKRN